MRTRKIGKLIYAVICLAMFYSVVNCYAANKKAEEFFEQGKKFTSDKNADGAIDSYSKAIKLDPKLAKAYNNRGIAYLWNKKFYLALADFSKAIKLDPKNGKAYNNRAIIYSYLGENDKARADLHKAQSLGIAVNPEFAEKIEALPSMPPPIFHLPGPTQFKAGQKK